MRQCKEKKKERNIQKKRLKMIKEEKEKILRDFFTEKEIQDFRNMVARDRKRRTMVNYGYHNIYKKENEIFRELNKKYPNLIDSKFPQILSNGYKYYIKGPSKQEIRENDWSLYYQKIKEYMGDEVYNRLEGGIRVTSYYVDKENKVIPITMFTYISTTITTYGLYGDEGAGFRLTDSYSYGITGDSIFYLENDKFIKSDEKDKGGTH